MTDNVMLRLMLAVAAGFSLTISLTLRSVERLHSGKWIKKIRQAG